MDIIVVAFILEILAIRPLSGHQALIWLEHPGMAG